MEKQNQEYTDTKLKGILEPLIAQLLIEKPDDVPRYMLEWIKKKYNLHDSATEVSSSEGEQSSEENEDELAPLPIRTKESLRPRQSVSAEAYGAWNKKTSFQPRVIPKTEKQKQRIQEKLTMSFIFSSLEQRDLDIVIDAMEEKIFAKDDVVIKQGDQGNELYVVDSGTLVCSRRFAEGQEPKFLKNYQSGEAFGELALLYNAPRAATIVANEACVLWCLDRPTFNNIVKEAAIKKRDKYEEFLKSAKILSSIEPYELTKIIDAVKPVEYKEGDKIIQEGEAGDTFFLLESGKAYATKEGAKDKVPVKVMQYKKGDYFGELALIRNTTRSASIFAETDCTCLTLDRRCFKRLLGPLDGIMRRNAIIYDEYAAKPK